MVGVLALATALASGCINMFWRTEPRALAPSAAPAVIRTPVKAHMADGSTVLFRRGATVVERRLTGSGEAYALLAREPHLVAAVPLDSVIGLETFDGRLLRGPTIAVSTAATVVGAVGTVALLKALFGSCPTVYADTGSGPLLQAEGFSYAIAPLLEHRDVDPLRTRPDADGVVRLELRNEALETHRINHVELLAVRHDAGTVVVPDQRGLPTTVGALRPLARATDRAGRDVRDVLAAEDGRLFASAPRTVDAARAADLDDWIDVEADGLAPGDSVAVVLRLRNSLLNTILLYDGMLGGRDAPEWLATGLEHIATTVELARWYSRTMGMHAAMLDPSDAARTDDVRLSDVGPIAFRDVAIVLPRSARDAPHVRVRLRFVADNWRIDHIAVAATVAHPTPIVLPLASVVVPAPAEGSGPVRDTAAVRALRDVDERYLETRPGQRMTLAFAPLPSPAAAARDAATTYLIAWQGWYQEWIRGSWLASPTRTTAFVPGDSAVATALTRWRSRRAELERAFYASRVPVR